MYKTKPTSYNRKERFYTAVQMNILRMPEGSEFQTGAQQGITTAASEQRPCYFEPDELLTSWTKSLLRRTCTTILITTGLLQLDGFYACLLQR